MEAHGRFTSILVPLDGSELADAVLERVIPIAVRERSTIHTLFVASAGDGRVELSENTALDHIDRIGERLSAAGLEHQGHLVRGDPAPEIVRVAAQLGVGLIAMSSHGRSGVDRWLHGSVAEQVLRNTSVPLFLVSAHSIDQGQTSRIRKILVPLSGSERSAAVLPWIVNLARPDCAEILLVRCEWQAVQRPLLAMELNPEKVAASLQPWREHLEAEGLRVRVLAKQGDAAHELLALANEEDVDLVALATHGRHGLPRLVEGSVTEKMLRHCRHPLLVVRAE